MEDDEDYEDESRADDNCPKCGRAYDEIDYEYQICHRCHYDNSKSILNEGILGATSGAT